jgi:putative DNA primase/helicase
VTVDLRLAVQRAVGQAAPDGQALVTRCVADIEPQPVRWLWPGRIARGKVTMLAGHPGLGKSQLALDIAATVTTGGRWPVDATRAERGSAVILSAEDDPADTIRPRLDAANADLARCHVIEAVQDIGDGGAARRRGFSLIEDLARLDGELRRIGDTALVIIDPITAYLGAIDSHRNAEVRAVLAPLTDLATQHGVAVLAITHLRKSLAGDAVLQVTGSLAFAAAARAVYIVAKDQDDPARRLLLPAKNNIGDDGAGYAYRIEPISLTGGIDTCRIDWEPDGVTITADEALAPRERQDHARAPKRNMATQWLVNLLSKGPVAVAELQREAKAAGYFWSTVRRAQDDLGITAQKTAYDGGWAWRLPEATAPGEEIEL